MSDWRQLAHEATGELLDRDHLLLRLFLEGRQQHPHEPSGAQRSKVAGSPTPWADRWTMRALEIQSDARRWHNLLTKKLFGTYRDRGGSHSAARGYLLALPDLIGALEAVDREQARDIAKSLAIHARSARHLLDEARANEQQPSRAPGGILCPHCGSALMLPPGWQHELSPEVYCPNDACSTPNGRRLSWPSVAWLAVVESLAPRSSASVSR